MQDDGEHIPHGAITLQRLSRSFETAATAAEEQQQQQSSSYYHHYATTSTTSSTTSTTIPHRTSADTTSRSSPSLSEQAANEPRETTYSTMGTGLPTKPATVWDAKDYSDLEVVVDSQQTWDSNDKMPVLVDTSEEKIAAQGMMDYHHHNSHHHQPMLLSPSLADPVPAYPASLHSRTSTFTNSPLTKGGDYTEYVQQVGDAGSSRNNGKKLLGMSNKRLSIVAAGLLGFILILLATVLAITLSMNNDRSGGRSVSLGASGSGNLLNTSRLAALNWTDTTGLDRSLVFYQDAGSSIMVSIRDSVSNEWAVTNITQAVVNSTGAKRLDVMPGTPLAAVTNLWQVSLYYLTSHNFLSEIWCSDVATGVWYAGSLAADLSPQVMNGSRLAAFWQLCANCSDSLVVLHQQPDGALMLANFTNNNWDMSGPVAAAGSGVVNQTGLAIRPAAEGSNSTTAGLGAEPNGWRAYEFDSTGIVELTSGPANNYTWEADDAINNLNTTSTAGGLTPELAAVTYGLHGWTNSVVTYLTSDGALMSYVRNDSAAWTSGQPALVAAVDTGSNDAAAKKKAASSDADWPTFTALAATQAMRIYAATDNGTILEYDMDGEDPLSWALRSTVVTTMASSSSSSS